MYNVLKRISKEGVFMKKELVFFGRYDGYKNVSDLIDGENIAQAVYNIGAAAERYSLGGNVIKAYLSLLMIYDENPFSLSCEKSSMQKGGAYSLALEDAAVLRQMFFYDYSGSEYKSVIEKLESYQSCGSNDTSDSQIGAMACALASELEKTADEKEFLSALALFYQRCGVGVFGINKAFVVKEKGDGFKIEPVTKFSDVTFDDLWGYENQKKQLCANTEDFVCGRSANNVLLYGAAGTGKSTSIKALLNQYWSRGLRIIDVNKYQFKYLTAVIDEVKNRNYHFIIYIDDLSFEDFEIEYKYLKSVIEGGIQPKPSNVLIYATSNRRHLIKESWSDRDDMQADVHHSDTVQEKLSLAERFGVAISFMRPVQDEYQQIVLHLAKRAGLNIPDNELLDMARVWELRHGGMSGRIARQFIDSLSSRVEKED